MNVLLISCFDHYESRLQYIKTYFEKENYNVTIVMSDYDHIKKEYFKKKTNIIDLIHTPAYKANISIARIFSHLVFSYRIGKLIKNIRPNLIYCLVPPNSLCSVIMKYKKKNPKTKIILDIIDLWPESLPIPKRISFFFRVWGGIRDKNLNFADLVFTECKYYQQQLKKYLPVNSRTLYLCKSITKYNRNHLKQSDKLNFVYLGSINNIIDIETIIKLLSIFAKSVTVEIHIIGTGEAKTHFITLLSDKGIKFQDYGILFDQEKKNEIFNKCDYGLNIYKKQTVIGLTMKSLDYFQAGLPIITSNIKDTEEMIEKYKAGLILKNTDTNTINNFVQETLKISSENYKKMERNVQRLFLENFSEEVISSTIEDSISSIL